MPQGMLASCRSSSARQETTHNTAVGVDAVNGYICGELFRLARATNRYTPGNTERGALLARCILHARCRPSPLRFINTT